MGAEDARKLFVGGLSDSMTEQDLRAIFEGVGAPLLEVNVPRDRETGRPRGFGFVTLATTEAAEDARAKLDGFVFAGRAMSVRRFTQDGTRRGSTERPARADERTLFLGKLPYDATAEEISALFRQYDAGAVERVTLPVAPDGRPRGFGFVTLESTESVAQALERLARAQLRGRQLVVTAAQPRGRGDAPGARGPSRDSGGRDGGYAREFGRDPAGARDGSRDVGSAGRGGGFSREGGFREGMDARSFGHHAGGHHAGGRDDTDHGYGAPHQREAFSNGSDPPDFSDETASTAEASGPGAEEGGRRVDSTRQRGKEKKKAPRATEKSARRERGGGGNWQRWDRDED